MKRTISEVVSLLESVFPDGPPTESEVRDQTEEFIAKQWLNRWPDSLPVPEFLNTQARFRVSRQELFEMAGKVKNSSDALEYYVWVAGWGAGTKARSTARSAAVLKSSNVSDSLWRSFATVQELGAVEAYRSLRTGGVNHVQGLGPSFFTKWMYFSAYDTWTDGSPSPLILDARVAGSLGNPGWKNWTVREYEYYVQKVDDIVTSWAPGASRHRIEQALFRMDRILSK